MGLAEEATSAWLRELNYARCALCLRPTPPDEEGGAGMMAIEATLDVPDAGLVDVHWAFCRACAEPFFLLIRESLARRRS